MRVHSSQLVPGCMLLRPVKGKTGQPIVQEKIAINREHIAFLRAFLIEEVDVYRTLADGKPFMPLINDAVTKEEKASIQHKQDKDELDTAKLNAAGLYQYAGEYYCRLFEAWQANNPVNMLEIRKLANMLMDRVDEFKGIMNTLPTLSAEGILLNHQPIAICIMSAYLSKKMGLDKKDIQQIGMAGLLCDAGLAKMPENLSTYGAKRRQGGESLLRQHPVYSYRMIEKVPGLHRLSKLAVLQHHERIDGSGYPIGLTADKLHLYSKIIAVCDTYYNLRCNYPDRSPYKLMEDMKQDEFTRLDPGIMKKMMQSFPDLSVGSMVLLSNGKRAKVMFKEPNAPIRPIVSVTDNEEIISLKDQSSIWIEQKLTANE